MQRFRRRLFNGLALISVILCFTTAGLWVQSYFYYDQMIAGSGARRWLILFYGGMAQVGQSRVGPGGAPVFSWKALPRDDRDINNLYSDARPWFFHFVHNATGWAASSPMWMLLSVPLALLIGHLYVSRRMPPGVCAKCGYDLRATPNRCPECGKIVEKAI